VLLLVGHAAYQLYDVATPGPLDRNGRVKAADFLQFYTYGTLAREGRWPTLYDTAAHLEVARSAGLELSAFQPNYSPAIAWAAAPLARLPYPDAMRAFVAVQFMAYGTAILLLVSIAGSHRRWGLLAALVWPTFIVSLRYGQISPLSLLLVAVALSARHRQRPAVAGIALGLLAYKPNLLIVPVLAFVITGQWRLLVGLAAGALGEQMLNLALAGPDAMHQYGEVLLRIARHPELVQFFPAESHSVSGFSLLLIPSRPLAWAMGWLAVPVTTWMVVRAWRVHDDWRPRWAALIVGALVASPHLLTYDLLLLAGPLVLLADWLPASRSALRGGWRWGLFALYFGAWPGTFLARLFHLQLSTMGMALVLWLLAKPISETGGELPDASPEA
jgi:hypothetical protein